MILLDTNVLSELMKANPNEAVQTWIDEQSGNILYISAITRAEIELGIALLPDGRRKRQISLAAQEAFKLFDERCLSFNVPAATHYAQIVAHRTRIGRQISVEDAQIAAIAIANGLQLATRNDKDFQEIDSLQIFNPWQ